MGPHPLCPEKEVGRETVDCGFAAIVVLIRLPRYAPVPRLPTSPPMNYPSHLEWTGRLAEKDCFRSKSETGLGHRSTQASRSALNRHGVAEGCDNCMGKRRIPPGTESGAECCLTLALTAFAPRWNHPTPPEFSCSRLGRGRAEERGLELFGAKWTK